MPIQRKRDPQATYHRPIGAPGYMNTGSVPIGMCGQRIENGHRSAIKTAVVTCEKCLAKMQKLREGARARMAALDAG